MTALIILIMSCLSFHVIAQEQKTLVVAADGTGDYKSVQEAINNCKAFADYRTAIRIRPGIYREKVEVFPWTPKISLVGEDPRTTIISFDDFSGKGNINTFTSWTVRISADDFYAENITFENSAGPVGQAVALHVEGDRCIFRNCRLIGNQDTVYTSEGSRIYFDRCYIEGTTDFIFGGALAVFTECHIHSKKNSYITAASTPEGNDFGYVFFDCKLTADSAVTRVFLGRPWRSFAKTVFIHCELGPHILPEGWHNWNKPDAEKTVLYAEYESSGPGAENNRVSWSKQLTREEVQQYSVNFILKGTDNWKAQ